MTDFGRRAADSPYDLFFRSPTTPAVLGEAASGGTTLISLYGWPSNPLVEYYVEENYSGSLTEHGTR